MFKFMLHTDLDGIGSLVLANIAYGKENVFYECHNYNTIDEAVIDFYESGNFRFYDKLYLVDISVRDPKAIQAISLMRDEIDVELFAHHPTDLPLAEYPWGHINTGNTCGTEMFFNYIKKDLKEVITDESTFKVLEEYVELTRLYDTWDWARTNNLKAKNLNTVFSLNKRSDFADSMVDNILCLGEVINEEQQCMIDTYERLYQKTLFRKDKSLKYIVYKDMRAGVVIAEDFISELGHDLLKKHPEIAFVVLVNMAGNTVSLRARDNEVDVKEIAESLGGGGHVAASGFRIPADKVDNILFNILRQEN